MTAGPEYPQTLADCFIGQPDDRPALGDLIGRLPVDPQEWAPPLVSVNSLDDLVRACAPALNENPDELLKLAKGRTPLARLVRLVLGADGIRPAGLSPNDLWEADQVARKQGLKGSPRLEEVKRQTGYAGDIGSLKRALERHAKRIREIEPPATVEELLSADSAVCRRNRPGPKPPAVCQIARAETATAIVTPCRHTGRATHAYDGRTKATRIGVETLEAPGKNTTAPDLTALPPDALLTRVQVAAISGFSLQTLKIWPAKGRGPKVTRVEGLPRYRVADVREWMGAANG